MSQGIGSHERSRYLDPGSYRQSAYPPETSRHRDHGSSYPGQHERAAYLPHSSRRDEHFSRSRPMPIYDENRPGPSSRSRSHTRSRHYSDDPNATVIYKNPKKLEDSD